MTTSQRAAYTISRTAAGPVPEVIERVTAALAEEGFGVLTTIDVQATLRMKLGEEVEPYVILGACNPHLAHRGLQSEPQLGALLPCNVVVREVDGVVHVDAMEPLTALGLIENADLTPIAQEAHERLARVISALG